MSSKAGKIIQVDTYELFGKGGARDSMCRFCSIEPPAPRMCELSLSHSFKLSDILYLLILMCGRIIHEGIQAVEPVTFIHKMFQDASACLEFY